MNRLTLEWVEAGQTRTQTISDQQATKQAGTFRIGRDPQQCDLVVQHPTVSKLHVEIFFDPQRYGFYLRNLRETNPPLVDQQYVNQGPVALQINSQLLLGNLEMRVSAINLALLPTVVTPPQPVAQLRQPIAASPPIASPVAPASPQPLGSPLPAIELSYGLQCPKCGHPSPYEHLEIGCAWCGTSLAAAQSVLFTPDAAS